MITTTNYKPEKISIGGLKHKTSRTGNRYQNMPILYDERKAIVHLCGRFMVIPDVYSSLRSSALRSSALRAWLQPLSPPEDDFIDEEGITDNSPDYSFSGSSFCSVAIEVDADNRKLFEDFEKKIQSEVFESTQTKQRVGEELKLIKKNDRVYLKVYLDEERSAVPKFWKVYEEDGEEKKKRIRDINSLNWKKIEGEIVFSIANIFVGRNNKSDRAEPRSIICVAKEILVREIMEEKSFSRMPVGEEGEVSE